MHERSRICALARGRNFWPVKWNRKRRWKKNAVGAPHCTVYTREINEERNKKYALPYRLCRRRCLPISLLGARPPAIVMEKVLIIIIVTMKWNRCNLVTFYKGRTNLSSIFLYFSPSISCRSTDTHTRIDVYKYKMCARRCALNLSVYAQSIRCQLHSIYTRLLLLLLKICGRVEELLFWCPFLWPWPRLWWQRRRWGTYADRQLRRTAPERAKQKKINKKKSSKL